MRSEFCITLVVDPTARRTGAMRGRVESCYGRSAFSGWLELLGQLEDIVDRAHDDASPGPAPEAVRPPADRA